MKFWLWIGHLKQVVGQLGTYFSFYNMIATSMILWRIVVKPLLDEYQLNIGIEWFIVVLVAGFTVLGVLEKKKGLRGFYQSWTQHFYTEDNPLRRDIEQLKKDVKELKDDKTSSSSIH